MALSTLLSMLVSVPGDGGTWTGVGGRLDRGADPRWADRQVTQGRERKS